MWHRSIGAELLRCLFELFQNLNAVAMEAGTLRGELQGARRAREEKNAQIRFQRLDRSTDGCGIDQQRASGPDKTICLDCAHEHVHRLGERVHSNTKVSLSDYCQIIINIVRERPILAEPHVCYGKIVFQGATP
jgi:hypothetical protein